jgi:hypothetical protein
MIRMRMNASLLFKYCRIQEVRSKDTSYLEAQLYT